MGNSARTVATWIKFNQYNPTGGSYIFSYGNAVNGQSFRFDNELQQWLRTIQLGAGYSVIVTINDNSNVFLIMGNGIIW